MTAKPHWTQTPEGKKRMGEIQKLAWKARVKRAKLRKTMAKERAAHASTNGHGAAPLVTYKSHPRQLMKETVRAFAILGAKQRLEDLEREREVLLMFIHGKK